MKHEYFGPSVSEICLNPFIPVEHIKWSQRRLSGSRALPTCLEPNYNIVQRALALPIAFISLLQVKRKKSRKSPMKNHL